jgi:superfamily II DNA or RNA helicase
MEYTDFLYSKLKTVPTDGIDVAPEGIHPMLYPFQRDIVSWALKLGKAALFEECGLGKTLQQIEWARHVAGSAGDKVLILAPLAVAHQTVAEGNKIDVAIRYCRSQADADTASEQIIITNYDMLASFDPATFAGVVLDESSILKSFTGTTKRQLLQAFADTPYKLACTATPAPNDTVELGNHAEFLGIMTAGDMLTRWFINDTTKAQTFRLKGHAVDDFWAWVASWAVCISKPSDLGYSDEGFILPELVIHQCRVETDHSRAFAESKLFVDANLSATDMWKDKRATCDTRADAAAELVASLPDEPWIVWCDTNDEANALMARLPEAAEVRGNHSIKIKEERLSAFSDGRARIIITKPDIAGFGLNWQHCANQVFVGVSYSYEKLYQCLRRSWRFGQVRPVNAHLIYAESEDSIIEALTKKQEMHKEMQGEMNRVMKQVGLSGSIDFRESSLSVAEQLAEGSGWQMHLGDCVNVTKTVEDESVDFMLFSPPFSTLYTYSDSWADMGNCEDDDQFFEHFGYLVPDLWRILRPGRLCAVHTKDLQMFKNRDGAAGIRDFTGDLTRLFTSHGWTYHSKITIWKDPVQEMQRTKTHGLLYKNFRERAEVCRQGMPEYVVVFRKWSEGMEEQAHVLHDAEHFPLELWQRYASPVWFDIDQTKVLNYQIARDDKDEKHICPLQLDVIDRCVELWTNPGDLVYSPFAGIGSEGYVALQKGRRFRGVELKRSYWDIAVRNLSNATAQLVMEIA